MLLHRDEPFFLSLVQVLRSQHISVVAADPLSMSASILSGFELCLLSLASVQVLDQPEDQITAHGLLFPHQ